MFELKIVQVWMFNCQCPIELQEIAHAVGTQKQASKKVYKEKYDAEVHGKAPADVANAYPEYDHHRKVTDQISKV